MFQVQMVLLAVGGIEAGFAVVAKPIGSHNFI